MSDCVIPHGGVFWVFPLLVLIGEVNCQVWTGCTVRGAAQPHITISIQHHKLSGSHHQQIDSYVKLPTT